MGRLFGTDGARGIAGSELTADLAMKIGASAAYVLGENKKIKVIVGMDILVICLHVLLMLGFLVWVLMLFLLV